MIGCMERGTPHIFKKSGISLGSTVIKIRFCYFPGADLFFFSFSAALVHLLENIFEC